MIILISNIDLVEYSYTALLLHRPLEIFSTVASLKPRPEYCLHVFLGYCSVTLIVYRPRPIGSFRLDGILSTRFSRLLFRRPYFLPFSANNIFSPVPLLFHRPYCLPLSTNRIFSAGPCTVCAFFSAIVPSPLLFTLSANRIFSAGPCFGNASFSAIVLAYFVLLKCSENRFNVTKNK